MTKIFKSKNSLLKGLAKKSVKELLANLSSEEAAVKFESAKTLVDLSKTRPQKVYPYLNDLVKLWKNNNKIIQWIAIDVVGNLSRIDKKKKIDPLIGKLIAKLKEGNLITAAHAISALTQVALSKPQYQSKITSELLKVEHYRYDTPECRNIAIGKVILALNSYLKDLKGQKSVIAFAKRQVKNTRPATRKKAEEFLEVISSEI